MMTNSNIKKKTSIDDKVIIKVTDKTAEESIYSISSIKVRYSFL